MSLDQTFSALGDPTRRAILARLMDGEKSLSEIAAPINMTQTGVTRHVTVLSDAGLVSVKKRGRTRYCKLRAKPMQRACQWLMDYEAFWDRSLKNLAAHLDKNP
ncbi:MAG: metalloregulator ArsR/SmtB family transcription factor [Pseudomonadota bacterium]